MVFIKIQFIFHFLIKNSLLFIRNFFRLVSAWILKNIFRLVSYWKIPCFLSRIFYKNHHFSEIFFRLVSALIFFKNGLFVKIKNFHRKKIFFQTDSKYQILALKKMPIFFIAHLKNTTRRTSHLNLKNFRKKSIFAIFFRFFTIFCNFREISQFLDS